MNRVIMVASMHITQMMIMALKIPATELQNTHHPRIYALRSTLALRESPATSLSAL
jgi:hypothetical protein